jgi:hypothetical protein
MHKLVRSLIVAAAVVGVAIPAHAQSSRSQPRTPFGAADFAKLKWLEGSWEGSAAGEASVFQRVRFIDDTTAEISYFRDPSLSQETGSGKLYLSVGRIYHTFGSNRWAATHADVDGLYFVPQTTARNNLAWSYQAPDAWTSTMRSGVSGHERVTVYSFKRIKR